MLPNIFKRSYWTKTSLIFGGITLWGLVLIGCVGVNRTVLAPAKIAGADYVGSKACAECHSDQTDHFATATHAKIALADPKLGSTGCEACHGPGSIHVKAGGGKGNIVNPRKSPEACFACHLEKRGEFSLPNTHPVMSGHVSCVDCHDVHSGNSIRGTGASMETMNDTCVKCHTAQKGPFVFEHGAMREGCVACHSPHGSVNQKMLVSRDANLCLRCHLETQILPGQINVNAINHAGTSHNSRLMSGTCWTAGCHEAIHGSNVNNHFRQ
ncbi:MAG TPA: cytochrome c3 family protein [Rariglobus sp.]|jgi:predicted CXXCH cytochrome family protein|nr:cytochrome c3 family protein [Rariglobus sp.]